MFLTEDKVARITKAQLRDIAAEKMSDLNATTIEAAEKIIRPALREVWAWRLLDSKWEKR